MAHSNSALPQLSRAIDLVHLARQSLGDKRLEYELLALFARQANQIVSRLAAADGSRGAQARAGLAHTLRGSALTVGAHRVAEAAADCEAAGLDENADRQIEALRIAVEEARSAVASLLAA